MKKLITILAILGIVAAFGITLFPSAVGAQYPTEWENCCEYTGCCRVMCCRQITHNYTVSYFEQIEVGIFQGKPCYAGIWKTVEVVAHNRIEAAEMLDLRCSYDCFVGGG